MPSVSALSPSRHKKQPTNSNILSPTALLIADCGATSGKWAYVDRASGSTVRFTTGPVNASIHDLTRITTEMVTAREQCPAPPSALHVYAAGAFGDNAAILKKAAADVFGLDPDSVRVESDLVGAARALLGNRRGVACILGTGSNSCLWNGQEAVRNMRPMGYILGDEGSGAAIGSALLRTALRGRLRGMLGDAWATAYPDVTYASVVEEVYRRHSGSSYIASFVPFVKAHITSPEMENIVAAEFRRFFSELLASYPELAAEEAEAYFTGGIASAFEPQLRTTAASCGVTAGLVCPDPLDMLVSRALRNG